MAKVELKKPVVEEISSKIQGAQSVVLATYSGITVEQDTALRKEMREAGVEYKVYKNTMMNFAFKGTACEELCKHLDGPNALAISKDDATAPARILAKYAKDVKAVKLVAGVVEDKYYDEAGIKALADIRQERYFLEDFLEVCSLRLQTLLVLLNRSLRKTAKLPQRLNYLQVNGIV